MRWGGGQTFTIDSASVSCRHSRPFKQVFISTITEYYAMFRLVRKHSIAETILLGSGVSHGGCFEFSFISHKFCRNVYVALYNTHDKAPPRIYNG